MSKQSEDMIIQAVQQENDGNLPLALELYQKSLALLLTDLKEEVDENKKQSLNRIIVKYMDIAEGIKKTLSQEKSVSSSTSKPTTTIASRLNLFKSSSESKVNNNKVKETTTTTTTATKPDYFDYSVPGREVKPKSSTTYRPSTTPTTPSATSTARKPSVPTTNRSTTPRGTKQNDTTTSTTESKQKVKSEDSKLSEYETQIQEVSSIHSYMCSY